MRVNSFFFWSLFCSMNGKSALAVLGSYPASVEPRSLAFTSAAFFLSLAVLLPL